MAEEEEDNNEEKTGESARSKLKMMLLILLGAILLSALSVGLTWFLLKDSGDPVEQNAADGESAEAAEEMSQEEQTPPAKYLAMQPAMVVNYQVGARTRFLQLELSMVARDTETIEAANKHMPLIRDRLLEVLSKQDYKALQTAEGKQQLIEALTATVQNVLKDKIGRPGVESVLFRSFVMQ